MNNDEFFTATKELQTIHQWARARYAAPWAVFGAVLLRVSASVGPQVQLPGLIGGRASLNLLCAFVSASGGGKGISDKVARLAWPKAIVELPIGSGEGIAATFKRPDKEDENSDAITAAIFNVPEVDTLAGIASRQGSILLAQLKSMAMGEQIGQQNASKATSRVVAAHTYRCCLSVGAQPLHTSVIFNDATGGTPQRFLWFPTTDPSMPAEAGADPAPLSTDIPVYVPNDDGVVEIAYGPEVIRETVIGAHLARQRGHGDALDGHALLTRCKVAALLAVLHHRSVVSELDWQLSEVVMTVSDATRDWITSEAKKAQRAKVRERAVARAAGDAVYDDRLLAQVKRSLLRVLERDGEQAGNVLRSRLGKREKRDLFDQAIDLLEHEGLVSSSAGRDRGARYKLIGQGEPVGQGAFPQVKKGDQLGQGEPEENAAEPENPSTPDASPVTKGATTDPNPEPEEPMKPPRPTMCEGCYSELPLAATEPLCDNCEGVVPKPVTPRPATPKLRTVHNGTTTDDGFFTTPAAFKSTPRGKQGKEPA
ncbi:Uncharacterised protein [Mycobacteroides abscessus subsp. abscessus]|uniref:hypothetical protein n=1 Tax=Mycobacteroides abscessus TaxID=36809 RepID=UPI0009271F6A|nr:hypothetical protein [Mycobacteroides abscessus]SIE28604.1 Uncharacterised protein [Mycobacteroides abscessus subsp. abscessus]SKV14632.1 Uncharacterised protein [Mycobacteroides abscessus subsp. abscessus]